jgi:hypothetical protein
MIMCTRTNVHRQGKLRGNVYKDMCTRTGTRDHEYVKRHCTLVQGQAFMWTRTRSHGHITRTFVHICTKTCARTRLHGNVHRDTCERICVSGHVFANMTTRKRTRVQGHLCTGTFTQTRILARVHGHVQTDRCARCNPCDTCTRTRVNLCMDMCTRVRVRVHVSLKTCPRVHVQVSARTCPLTAHVSIYTYLCVSVRARVPVSSQLSVSV